MDLDKFYKWEGMAVSSIIHLMIKWFNFESIEMLCYSRHNVESGIWYDIKIVKGGNSWSVSSQRLELLRDRLIKFLDGQNVREDYLKREGEKIKVSSHETDLQSADSGQLQQHNVMESLPLTRKLFDELIHAGRDMEQREKMGLYCLSEDEYFKEIMKRNVPSGNAP